jgi:hypothetical protein
MERMFADGMSCLGLPIVGLEGDLEDPVAERVAVQ